MRTRLVLGRLALVVASGLFWLVVLDLWMRASVGECGLTPFRNSAIEALPHELVPGRVTTYKGVEVHLNQAGFRGPEIAPKPAGERIALIGDSVTFGNGCPEDGTLAAALARELGARDQAVEVLNCGVPAYNAPNVATILRERVLALQPTRVLYVMVANDVTKAQRKTVIPEDATIDAYADFPLGSPLIQFVKARIGGLLRAGGLDLDGYVESVLAQFEQGGGDRLGEALSDMQAACRERSVEFAVVVYPYLVRPDRNPFRPIEDDCAKRCAALAIPCVRVSDAFAPDQDLTKFWVAPLDAHPDAAANAIAARQIVERLPRP